MDWSTVITGILMALTVAGSYFAAKNKAAEVALSCWRDLADAREREALVLRERLTSVEQRLTETERLLEVERERNTVLENKVEALEKERAAWRRERSALMKRIEELEGCR